MRSDAALLEVRRLTKRFGGLTAVAGLDFTLAGGEILGLIGPNGAGKTTTFNVIAGAFDADEGEVSFAGEPILGLAPHRIAARGIMRTFQHNRPFAGMPVIDNVLVGAHVRFRTGLWRIVANLGLQEEARMRRRAGELCDALLERCDSQAMLERLERAQLFIQPLDSHRHWYRYHTLFLDFLRSGLRHDMARLCLLHERASRWHAEHQLYEEALYHAFAADNEEWRLECLERCVWAWLRSCSAPRQAVAW